MWTCEIYTMVMKVLRSDFEKQSIDLFMIIEIRREGEGEGGGMRGDKG